MQYICKYIYIYFLKNISYQTYFQLVSPWLYYYQLTHYASWWFEQAMLKQVKELDPLLSKMHMYISSKNGTGIYTYRDRDPARASGKIRVHVALSHQKTKVSNKCQASITLWIILPPSTNWSPKRWNSEKVQRCWTKKKFPRFFRLPTPSPFDPRSH